MVKMWNAKRFLKQKYFLWVELFWKDNIIQIIQFIKK